MLYAIVSDIHANRQAWQAVLNDIRAHGVDEILCLGDIVDYGPAPADVLRSVYARCRHIVVGNHDAALCGRLDSASFNPRARRSLEWTSRHVDAKALGVLAKLPMVLQGPDFTCVHSSPLAPSQYSYLIDTDDVHPVWDSFSGQICFVGHSHVPGVFIRRNGGATRHIPPRDFQAESDRRFIVNVGSVGQPRDGGMLAGYVLFDQDDRSIYFRQVPFDIEGYEKEFAASGAPEAANDFLAVAGGAPLPAVRELIDFSPPAEECEAASVRNLEQLARSLRRWRALGFAALLLCAAMLLGLMALAPWHRAEGGGVVYGPRTSEKVLRNPGLDEELLAAPEALGKISAEQCLQWYSAMVADPERQTVFAEIPGSEPASGTGDEAVFRLRSSALLPFAIGSLPAIAPAGSRFRVRMQFKSPLVEKGFVELLLVERRETGEERVLGRGQPQVIDRKDRWYICSATLERPLGGGEKVAMVIRGEIAGEISFRKLQFSRCE